MDDYLLPGALERVKKILTSSPPSAPRLKPAGTSFGGGPGIKKYLDSRLKHAGMKISDFLLRPGGTQQSPQRGLFGDLEHPLNPTNVPVPDSLDSWTQRNMDFSNVDNMTSTTDAVIVMDDTAHSNNVQCRSRINNGSVLHEAIRHRVHPL